jgi:hypothetical protein
MLNLNEIFIIIYFDYYLFLNLLIIALFGIKIRHCFISSSPSAQSDLSKYLDQAVASYDAYLLLKNIKPQ